MRGLKRKLVDRQKGGADFYLLSVFSAAKVSHFWTINKIGLGFNVGVELERGFSWVLACNAK